MLKELVKSVIPRRFLLYFSHILNNHTLDYSLKSYSQEGEDMILRRLFENQQSGFYIDVGAHHPKRFSNTYFFYKKGWSGINIDAMPGSMKLFNQQRTRDINIEKPISDEKKILTYYAFDEPAFNGFSKELSKERAELRNCQIKFTKDIETTTLKNVLDEHLPKNQEIDFLSIDVEGLDFLVLKSNNFDEYRPKIIIIELLDSSLANLQNNDVTKYLKERGYSIFAKAIYSVFFIDDLFLKNWKK